jgi:hypothetical protein
MLSEFRKRDAGSTSGELFGPGRLAQNDQFAGAVGWTREAPISGGTLGMAARSFALVALSISAVALIGLYVAFERSQPRAAGVTPPPTVPVAVATPTPSTAPALAPVAPEGWATPAFPSLPAPGPALIAIAKLKPGVGIPPVQAKQGDQVTIVLTSDKTGTVEIHGYGRSIAVKPGIESTLAFRADYAGRFPIHLHTRDGGHLEVTALEVQPK